MLSKSIYVSSITNLSDARYCAGMGVEFLGICLDVEKKDYISLETFKEIKNWLVGVKWVGETSSIDLDLVKELVATYELDALKTESLSFSEELRFYSIPTFTEVKNCFELENIENNLFIISDLTLNNLEKIKAELLQRLYLKGDYSIDELTQLNELADLKGILLSGGDEIRPGFKDMDKLIDEIEVFEII